MEQFLLHGMGNALYNVRVHCIIRTSATWKL